MNDSISVIHRPWRAEPSPARTAAAIIATAVLAVLAAAACSGSPSSTGDSPNAGGPANSPSAVGYSHCMRSHGVPNFPDPDSSGQIPKEAVIRAAREVSDSRLRAATQACESLNPAGQGSPTLTAQQQQDYLKAAACMRSHGISDFPDPTFPGGRVNLSIPSSINTRSRQFIQAAQTCTKLIPAGLPYSRGSGSGSGG